MLLFDQYYYAYVYTKCSFRVFQGLKLILGKSKKDVLIFMPLSTTLKSQQHFFQAAWSLPEISSSLIPNHLLKRLSKSLIHTVNGPKFGKSERASKGRKQIELIDKGG